MTRRTPIEALQARSILSWGRGRVPFGGVAVLAIVSLCALSIVGLANLIARKTPVRQLLSFGAEGHQPGQFYHATYLAIDGKGHSYIGDWDDGRINVFDAGGTFIRQIELGQGTEILGMAAAADGTLYVSYDGLIHVMKPDGGDATLANQDAMGDLLSDISGIAVGPDGSVAAADNFGDMLRFEADGKAQVVLARAFDLPSFSSQNELHQGDAPILSYDVPANNADRDLSLAVDSSGNIYAVGWTLGNVVKTDAHGKALSKFGGFTPFPPIFIAGKFDFPDGLAVDAKGRIYVADSKGVQVFGPDMRFQSHITVDSANAVALDAQGNIYVLSYPDKVIKFSALE